MIFKYRISKITLALFQLSKLKVPPARLEHATARSSAECSPGLSYGGTFHYPILGELKCVSYFFQAMSEIFFLLFIVLATTKRRSDNLFM